MPAKIILFTDEQLAVLKPALYSTWSGIAPDCEEFVRSNRGAMEMTLDADRIGMFGHKEAQEIVSAAFKAHDYKKVFNFLCKTVQLY